MKIEKEKYLATLDVVEQYHAQLKVSTSTVETLSEVTLCEFIRDVKLSMRLRNALSIFIQSKSEQKIYLEELNKSIFYNIRNVGLISWKEFSSKRDEYMQERHHRKEEAYIANS